MSYRASSSNVTTPTRVKRLSMSKELTILSMNCFILLKLSSPTPLDVSKRNRMSVANTLSQTEKEAVNITYVIRLSQWLTNFKSSWGVTGLKSNQLTILSWRTNSSDRSFFSHGTFKTFKTVPTFALLSFSSFNTDTCQSSESIETYKNEQNEEKSFVINQAAICKVTF